MRPDGPVFARCHACLFLYQQIEVGVVLHSDEGRDIGNLISGAAKQLAGSVYAVVRQIGGQTLSLRLFEEVAKIVWGDV